MILSERLLGELSEVLMRPRFRRYATEEEVEEFLFGLREKGIFFEEDVEAERLVPDDPKDDYLVALTRASSADYLVSGDPHLAGAKDKVPVIVLTPRQFGELLESESPWGTMMNLLSEHRQALITAAVTGQFEVPGVAAS